MSTIKVTNLQNASAASPAIVLDANSRATLNGLSYPTEGSLSGRNFIINGAHQIAQRGTSFSGVSGGAQYPVDRFRFSTDIGTWTVSQSTTAPTGFSNSIKCVVTTANASPSSTGEAFVEQAVEAQNLQALAYGSASAKPITVSFWVRSNKTGTYGLWILASNSSRQYSVSYTISAANTWEQKTITVPGLTTNAINNDNSSGLLFRWYLAIGSTYAGTPAATWQASDAGPRATSINVADTLSNEWHLAGVQVEQGSVATPFERRSYGQELALCQRYYQKIAPTTEFTDMAMGHCLNTTLASFLCKFTTSMRSRPTALETTGIAGNYMVSHSGTNTSCSVVPTFGSSTLDSIGFDATVASGLTLGRGCLFRSASATTSAFLAWSAEL